MENRKRLNHIESIRAFAALSVGIFHFTNASYYGAFLVPSEAQRHFFTFGAQGVEIFYVISGFIIPYSLYHSRYTIQNYFRYLGKRLSRLLPPYFATIAAITLVGIFLTKLLWGGGINIEWRNIAANAFFAVDFINAFDWLHNFFPDNVWINPIFETLKVELQFYLLIGLIFPLLRKNRYLFIVFALMLLVLGIYTIHMNTLLVNSPYFLLGICGFFIFEEGWKKEYLIVLAFCAISLFRFYYMEDLIAAFVGFTLITWLPSNFKFLNFTGKISYSYYLIHGLAGGEFLYFTRDSYLSQNHPYLMVLFALLISWLAAFLMYFCIEKPSLIISKRIKYKTKKEEL